MASAGKRGSVARLSEDARLSATPRRSGSTSQRVSRACRREPLRSEYYVVVIGARSRRHYGGCCRRDARAQEHRDREDAAVGGTTVSGGMVWVPKITSDRRWVPTTSQRSSDHSSRPSSAHPRGRNCAHHLAEAPKRRTPESDTSVRRRRAVRTPTTTPTCPGRRCAGACSEPVPFDARELGDWFPQAAAAAAGVHAVRRHDGGAPTSCTSAMSSSRRARRCACAPRRRLWRSIACASTGGRASCSATRSPAASSSRCWTRMSRSCSARRSRD